MQHKLAALTIIGIMSVQGCGTTSGYAASCNDHHDDRPLAAGYLIKGSNDWESSNRFSSSESPPYVVRNSNTDHFSRSEAQRQCDLHLLDYPGHDCKVDRLYEVGGMG